MKTNLKTNLPVIACLITLILTMSIVQPVSAYQNESRTSQTSTYMWIKTGSPQISRISPSATLLLDGRVLIVGGTSNPTGLIAETELYDPVTGTFTYTGKLNDARNSNTATLLPNGKVLIVGGAQSTAELYDPLTGTFTRTQALLTPRTNHTATALPDGKVLIAGGFYTPPNSNSMVLSTAELFDPATNSFTTTGSMTDERYGHTATLLKDGKVLIVGGIGVDYKPHNSAELYDPATGTFTKTGDPITGRYSFTASALENGKVLIVGGYTNQTSDLASAELYDPVTGTFTQTGDMKYARSEHSATLLSNGNVLVVAGYGGSFLNTAEIYDPTTGTWRMTRSISDARVLHAATRLSDGRVLIIGGGIFQVFNLLPWDSAELFVPAVTDLYMPWTPSAYYVPSTPPIVLGSQLFAGTVQVIRVEQTGNPSLNEANEYVELRNVGQTPGYLDGWRLKAIHNTDNVQMDEYTFPSGSVIAANQTCRIYTNLPFGVDNCGFVSGFSNDQPLWPASGARAELYNNQNQLMSRFAY